MWTTLDYQIVRIDMYTYALVFAAGFAAFFFGEFVFFAMPKIFWSSFRPSTVYLGLGRKKIGHFTRL
jgi:hypothetical protein